MPPFLDIAMTPFPRQALSLAFFGRLAAQSALRYSHAARADTLGGSAGLLRFLPGRA